MEYDLDEPFEVQLLEDNNPDRPHFYIYTGLLDSDLFDANETILIIYLIASAHDNEINTINTTAISINRVSQKLGMSRVDVRKYIKLLEEKGVLVKKGLVSEDDDCFDNTYMVLNYISVWDCKTLDELKRVTDRIKKQQGIPFKISQICFL